MHDNPIPAGWETPPLACTGEHEISYDVSIDSTSGLAVPVNMVANEDGREGIVTVANSGPDQATGSVTVVGELNGVNIVDETFEFTDLAAGASPNPLHVHFADLAAAGATQSFTFPIVPGAAGTINWTATVTAEYDTYAPNNTVTGKTEVKAITTGE